MQDQQTELDSLGQQGATNESYSPSVGKDSGFIARVARHEQDFADRLRQAGHTAETCVHGFRDAGDFGATKGHLGFVIKDESGDAHAFVVAPALVPQVSEVIKRFSAENNAHLKKPGCSHCAHLQERSPV